MRKYDPTNFDKGNGSAALIILSGDPATFGVGLVAWARAWQTSHPVKARRWEKPPVATQDGPQLKLFSEVNAK